MLTALFAFWLDFLAVGGFVLTIVGFVATLLSLYYAIRQLRETKSAAVAAREAATAALVESRRNYLRHVAANSHRYVNEVIIHVENQAWQYAALRLDDLADQLAQLGIEDPECKPFADEVRSWAATAKGHAAGGGRKFAATKWTRFLLRLRAKIDSYYGPFPASDQESSNVPRQDPRQETS